MGLKDYEYLGSTWQFDEGQQPESAVAVDAPAAAETVFVEIDEAARAAESAKVAEEAELAAEIEAERVAAEAAEAEKLGEKQKTPQNKAATPATK